MGANNMFTGEFYDEFLERVLSFQKPEFSFGTQQFKPSQSVWQKVDECGRFNPFFGDTVVFELAEVDKNFIYDNYICTLYAATPECFAERIRRSTLHMTLHDLNASADKNSVLNEMFQTEIGLAKLLQESDVMPQSINMLTTCVFNMVSTSLVLGLVPKTPADYYKLMKLYNLVDQVHKLPYLLTPHITLAYYSRDGLSGERLEELEWVVNQFNKNSFEITLSTSRLFYQKFTSMNEYFRIMPFVR